DRLAGRGWIVGDNFTRAGRLSQHHWRTLAAVYLGVSNYKLRACRLPLRQHARALGAVRHARKPDTRSGTRDRAVCGGLCLKRWHRRSELSFSELAEQLGGGAQLARISLARHGRPQPQVRLHRNALHRRPEDLRYQLQPNVPRHQRPSEWCDPVGATDGTPSANPLQRLLRPGTVDALTHDAAGRDSVRSVLELLPGADASTLQLSAVHGELSTN